MAAYNWRRKTDVGFTIYSKTANISLHNFQVVRRQKKCDTVPKGLKGQPIESAHKLETSCSLELKIRAFIKVLASVARYLVCILRKTPENTL